MGLLKIQSMEHFKHIVASNALVVTYIYGDNCQPCKMLEPNLEKFSNSFRVKGVAFTKENFTQRIHDVNAVPCVFFYANGKRVNEEVYGADLKKIMEITKSIVDKLELGVEGSRKAGDIKQPMSSISEEPIRDDVQQNPETYARGLGFKLKAGSDKGGKYGTYGSAY